MPSPPDYVDPRLTERRNPRTIGIDVASSQEIVDLLNAEDRGVAEVVGSQREALACAVDLAHQALRSGGRVIYVGAGTSGRLGVLDASECPPTFGSAPDRVVGVIAGGPPALTRSQEGAEDDTAAGAAAMDTLAVSPDDAVVGIAASGTTPYVVAALDRAADLGAPIALITCADPPADLARRCAVVIALPVGPEALTGSTRLKAGTATKMALNTISTGAMLRWGKAYGNLMVDLRAWSAKLVDRSERVVMEAARVDRPTAARAIAAAGGSAKLAVVMTCLGVSADEAERLLTENDGRVRAVVGEPPSVVE